MITTYDYRCSMVIKNCNNIFQSLYANVKNGQFNLFPQHMLQPDELFLEVANDCGLKNI